MEDNIANEKVIAAMTELNAKMYLAVEPHLRRLANLVIGMEVIADEIRHLNGDDILDGLAEIIDAAANHARSARAAMR